MFLPRTSSMLRPTSRARWVAFCREFPKWQLSVAHLGRFPLCKWASWPWTPPLSLSIWTSQTMLMSSLRPSEPCGAVAPLSSVARPSQPTPRGSKPDRTMLSRLVTETVLNRNILSQSSAWGPICAYFKESVLVKIKQMKIRSFPYRTVLSCPTLTLFLISKGCAKYPGISF